MKGKLLTGILILMFVSPNTSYPCPNIPPNVIITAPSDGALFKDGDDITIEAHAWDDDGQVTKVEFYSGTTKIGEDTSEPYSYLWTDVSPGSYTLKAIAYDNRGAWADSVPVNIIVGNIWYVDKDATGVGDGQSWEDAYNYLQDALAVAAAGDEIRIAGGVYRPDQYAAGDSGLREETFRLKNRVVIKGGYAGFGESNPDTRDMAAYETVLSGDIGYEGDDSDNSYHVVTADDPDIDNSTVLDGFTIGGGNANGGTVYYGGGLLVLGEEGSEPELTVVNCVFRNNRAYYGGGGICCSYASPTLTNCIFSRNSARDYGGGMHIYYASPTLVNCVFSQNKALSYYHSGYGGGISNVESSTKIVNCTFHGNVACRYYDYEEGHGGGLYYDNASASPAEITNCIFWDNKYEKTDGSFSTDQSAQIYCENGQPQVNYTCVQGWNGALGGTGNTGDDPRFVHADNPTGADNVFGTLDDGLYLRPDSPYNCIDMGHERDVAYPDVPDDDITGYARPADGDHSGLAGVDMGAYETVPVWYVKANAEGNNDGTSWTNARNYLQDALVSDAVEGDEIWVAKGNYRPDEDSLNPDGTGNRTATFQLVNGVAIYGGFAGTEHSRAWRDWTKNEAILSGDLLGDDVDVSPEELLTESTRDENSYHVVTGNSTDATAVLDGFTIAAGNANMTTGGHDCGGGISNNAGSPTLTNCILTGNSANDEGGGLHNIDSDPTLTNCTVSGNAASFGGGLCNIGSSPTIANCVFCSNSASAYGGGVYNSQSCSRLTNCTFSGNNAGNQGGGICNNGPYPEIINCIIWGNTAASEASIYNINSYNLDDDPSLVAWWRFNEGEGDTAYDSAGDNDGTIYGAQWTTGQIDGALDFDGDDDYVNIGNDSSLKPNLPISVSMWVKLNSLRTNQWLISNDIYPGSNYYGIWGYIRTTNQISISYGDGGSRTSWNRRSKVSTSTVSSGEWQHIAFVIKGATDMDIYINGTDAGGTYSGTGGALAYSTGDGYIGSHGGTTYFIDGTIDDVRIYNRSLTEGEVGSLLGFIRYSNIEGCGGSGEWDASFGTDGGGNIDEDPCFANSDNPAGTDGVFGTSDDGLRLKPDSPCIDTADGDAALDTDVCGEERLDIEFIPNAGIGIPDYADIGAYEYDNSPGYTTSFEQYQGYDGYDIEGIDGWQVEAGDTYLAEAVYREDNGGEIDEYPYQHVRVYSNSTISHGTSDSCGKTFIRVNCIPSPGSFINIMNGSSPPVASIKFEQNGTISVWHNGSYATTSNDYSTIATQCRNFLSGINPENGLEYYYDDDTDYSYENTWIEFTIEFDWENHTYDVSWAHWDIPEGASIYIYTGASFHPSHRCYTKVEFKTGSDSTSFEFNRMSISDMALPGGVVGPDEEDDAWLIAPEADILNPLKGQCIVAGPMWYDSLGEYVVKCCPADLDSDDPGNWIQVCSGRSISREPIQLGFWNTEAFYNGDYFLKIEVYDDIGRRLPQDRDEDGDEDEAIISTERVFNGTSKTCKVRYPIIGRAKARTFHYEEHPDFTINWPGTFPFEFKRMYNNGLRARIYPLFFGWTHNHNIRSIEDCQYDWIVDVDEFEIEKPAGDVSGLGIGRLWLCRPLGGEMFIGHVNSQNPQEVIYEPLDNENQYIIRTSSVDNSDPDNPEFTVTYVYYAPDGMKMTFNKVFTGPRSVPADEGLVDWIVVAGIDEQADRFGNKLVYEWSSVDEKDIFLDKISNNRTPANLRFTYDDTVFFGEGGPRLCSEIKLYKDYEPTDGYVGFFSDDVVFEGIYHYYAALMGEKDYYWPDTTSEYEYSVEPEFILTEIVPGDSYVKNDTFHINVKHNDDGSLIERQERFYYYSNRWSGSSYQPTEQYNYEYDDRGNLITTIQVKSRDDSLLTLLREEVAVTSPEGKLFRTNVRTFPVCYNDQQFAAYNYQDLYESCIYCSSWFDSIFDLGYHAGGGGATDTEYYYEDQDFPLKPTKIIEFFHDGDGVYDETFRKTTREYDDRGNIIKKKVYVDDVNYVYTEYAYHQDYDFPIRKTTWQDYCHDEGETVVTSGAKVEKKWLYGDADGTLIGDGSLGDYLVQESTLLAEAGGDQWAEIFYSYISGGRVKIKEDPAGSITYYEYDDEDEDDGYGFLEKEWQGATLNQQTGLPGGNPQKRYYYDGLGRKILEADYLGKVQMNVHDDAGRVIQAREYFDQTAITRVDFEPDSYDERPLIDDYQTPGYEDDWWENRTLYSDYGPWDKPGKITFPTGGFIRNWYVCYRNGLSLYHYSIAEDRGDIIVHDSEGYGDAAADDGRILQEIHIDDTKDDASVRIIRIYDSMRRLLHKYSYFDDINPDCYHDLYKYIKHEEYQYDTSGNKISEAVYSVERGQSGFEPDSGVLEKSNSYEYDILGRLTKKVVDSTEGGLNQTTEYGYDAAGNRIYVIDPNGNVTFTDYDNANRKVCEYFAAAPVYIPGTDEIDFAETKATAVVRKEVDYYNNNKTKDANSYDYDGSLLACTEYIYNSRGRIEQVRELIEDIDENNQMDPTIDDIATTSYEYSDDGSRERIPEDPVRYHIVIQDAENKKTGIRLSYHGKPVIITYPSGDYEEYAYYSRALDFGDPDPHPLWRNNGLLEKKAVWDGGTKEYITYRYDDYGKVQTKIYGEGDPGDPYLEYDYTSRFLGKYGKVKTITDYRNDNDRPGAEGSKFTFDYWYLTGKVKSYGDYEGYTVHYDYLRAYDRKSEVQVTDPYETVIYHVKNSYDLAGRLIDVREPLLGNDDLIADLDYDNNGNRDMLTYSLNGKEILDMSVSVDYNYNLDNLLTGYNTTSAGVTGPTFTLDDVVVDGLGRLVSAGETITEVDNVGTISYLLNNFTNPPYDMRSQLIKARVERTTAPTSVWEGDYTYRKDGNLDTRQETDMSQPAAFEYDFDNNGSDDGDIMTGATGGETFTLGWDWNGNMTSTTLNSGLNFTYNWDNKLRKVEQDTTVVMSVKYDPIGNRIFKDSSEAEQRKYIVDIAGNLPTILLEIGPGADGLLGTGDDVVTKTYIYGNSQILAQHDGDHTASRYFYLHDRLGSVRQVIDTSGNVKNRYIYKPFGELYPDPDFEETVTNPFKFTGQFFDSEIDEYYLHARQYDPHIARFTARDPVRGKFREPMTLHKYLYCGNDPINRIDPDGRFFGLASLLVSRTMESQLRKMDYKFHMDVFNRTLNNIDAFSLMNLQRGLMYDVIIADFDDGLKKTLRDSGIAGLGQISENFSRLVGYVGYAATAWDNREALSDIFGGEGDSKDYYDITSAILDIIVGGL